MDKLGPLALSAMPALGIATMLSSDRTANFALKNALVQTLVFIPAAQIPALVTGIMSWVDVAWPLGLVALGVQTKLLAEPGTNPMRNNLIAALYLFQGGRMALGALLMASQGHMSREMPRYMYQFRRWKKQGVNPGTLKFVLTMQKEIFMQAVANMGVLSIPAALSISNSTGKSLRPLELFGVLLWMISYSFEHTSDVQKLKFVQKCKKEGIKGACCKEGFWAFSRHPNYFGEWGVWVSLCVIAYPSLLDLYESTENKLYKFMMSLGLISPAYAMYVCLTWWTGAIPAEFYSVQKRPDYKEYQKTVPMFFPDFVKMFNHYLQK